MTGPGGEDGFAPGERLVPFASYTRHLAEGFALVAVLIVVQRMVLWSLEDAGQRQALGAVVAQLLALPVLAGITAAAGGWLRDRKRELIYAGLPDATHEHPEDLEVVDDPDGLHVVVRRVVLRVLGIWFALGLVLPLMASLMAALSAYAWVVARWEARATARDGRELLTRPRWFIWLPVAWRTVNG